MKKLIPILICGLLISCRSEPPLLNEFDLASDQRDSVENLLEILSDNDLGTIKKIIDKEKIDINFIDRKGKSLLLVSLLNEDYLLISKLLKLGANPNLKSGVYKKKSLIGLASSYKNEKILSMFLDNGADPNLIIKDEFTTLPPIFDAINTNRLNNMKLLISFGADVNITDRVEFTPLMLAAATGKWEALFILLNSGANYSYINKYGKSVVTYVEVQGLGVSGEQGQWRRKVFGFFNDKGLVLNPRVPL
ncbi:ankyrin repeat domain-containing protein [Marinomonas sp. PE14-40]|uniref:ankyrin repeat domain-containing protein n=1 Tax=Marinomonas sp. PE14-40 TaxID=3060621 RepID=UPI003F67B00E